MRLNAFRAALAAIPLFLAIACDPPFSTGTVAPSDKVNSIAGPVDSVPADKVPVKPRPDSTVVPEDSLKPAVPAGRDSGAVAAGGFAAVPVFDPDVVPLEKPVWFGNLPGRNDAYLVLEQYAGTVSLIRKSGSAWAKSAFLKVAVRAEGEMGLLGIAFHPRFADNRKYYVHYVPAAGAMRTLIEEREADAGLLKDAGKAPRRILSIPQPYQNHKAGTIGFGPKDGYLYVPTGDGGATAAGQDRMSLLGKVLRVDVNAPDSFRVPADNPFIGRAGTRPEIWALGLRNPWKWSFDPVTGVLWAGDVGETEREEIDKVGAGANLGWGFLEGTFCHADAGCAAGGMQPPLLEFGRGEVSVIIGGNVYRGDPASPHYGAYFFADYASREIWMLPRQGEGHASAARKILTLPSAPASFGTDASGNLYLVGHGNGVVYRLEATDSGGKPRGRL